MNYTDILKQNWKKYLTLIIASFIVGVCITTFREYLSPAKVFIFLASLAGLAIAGSLCAVVGLYIKRNYFKLKHKVRKYFRQLRYRFLLLKSLNKILKHNYANHSVEIVFAMFEHWYRYHLDETELLSNHENLFPEGRFSLTQMHIYITKTRIENASERAQLVQDVDTKQFTYWGERYDDFVYTLKHGKLLIFPNNDLVDSLVFWKKCLKIDNALYELDNEKADWIIKRRKYLSI